MEKKKLKLTISGSSKKTINNIELAKSKNKNSVVIEKKNSRFVSKTSYSKNNNQKNTFNRSKTNFTPRDPFISKPSGVNDFEKRKLAEQRATKRLKGETLQKGKLGSKRRELKLTVSRALSEDDIGFKSRSLASLKRAKQKENKELKKEEVKENLQNKEQQKD